MSLRMKLLATVAVLGCLAAAVAAVVHSSFTATARSDGNEFRAGSISLTDDDSGRVLFDLDALEPGSPPERRCVSVSYGSTGGLASAVRLYGETAGSLAEHLRLKVLRGRFDGPPPGDGRCTGLSAETTTVFDGTLAAYPDSWAGGIADPNPAWQTGERRAYAFEVSLADTDAAQGKSATQAFVFEARTR